MALPLAASDPANGAILIAISLIVLPVAAIAFARSGGAWRSIGRGPFAIDQDLPRREPTRPSPPVDRAVQAAEARQMIEAKSYRRTCRGESPLDVEAEVARLLDDSGRAGAPGREEELRAEVRQLVVARNERRMRRGEAPLDVEAETERELADL